jgi:CubicO group peptidase (beta-lactamase class C family)
MPGERWLYHMSAEILGVLIARITGKSLGEFLQQRLFEPLGMLDTAFHVPEGKRHRLPACYGTDFLSGKLVELEPAGGGYASRPDGFESVPAGWCRPGRPARPGPDDAGGRVPGGASASCRVRRSS